MNATTTDPMVVFGVVLATAGTWLLAALVIKAILDRRHPYAPAQPTALAGQHWHALPAALDETQPITCMQATRARHRKGSR